ncbi:homoserine dehydrogenase [Anaerobacillus alkalilacustris]|uniref:Homoserine dehydrogenase n=1 Tax=Anaerobacillus alkalilacustris TaxID=393763 RepID=A0A1S2LPQ6_9BACI|nr:homoserine dehydrogenase [Anaerobacillus alkalilacustris]OIJ13647.1 homoserine dehydrogenase [Anaerobacillus alkalilacustris]
MTHRVAILGFGVVGQGFAEVILQKKDLLQEKYGKDISIVAISDLFKGALYHPDGLSIEDVVKVINETGSLHAYPEQPGLIRGLNSFETIEKTNADTIIEVTFTDVLTGQPAIDHCKFAFENQKNVIMSNKGPVALAYEELQILAKKQGVFWGFEGSVMSGTPALRMPMTSLAGNEISAIKGILNGTTNYMLTRMEEGLSYDESLKEAQQLGYAEADPTSDVEGFDALYKIVILANVIMGYPLKTEEVKRRGISHLTEADIELANVEGKRWKLIAQVKQEGGKCYASVGPEMISLKDSLAGVSGATNAITYECDLIGPVTLQGAGAGKVETAFSILIDLLNVEQVYQKV